MISCAQALGTDDVTSRSRLNNAGWLVSQIFWMAFTATALAEGIETLTEP